MIDGMTIEIDGMTIEIVNEPPFTSLLAFRKGEKEPLITSDIKTPWHSAASMVLRFFYPSQILNKTDDLRFVADWLDKHRDELNDIWKAEKLKIQL